MEGSRHKPHDLVAQSGSWFIDGVDRVPVTHKQRGWVHAWTSADGRLAAPPLPVDAKPVPPMLAVSIMTLVLVAVAVTAVATVLGAGA